jgi:hypothetical protein
MVQLYGLQVSLIGCLLGVHLVLRQWHTRDISVILGWAPNIWQAKTSPFCQCIFKPIYGRALGGKILRQNFG